MGCNAWNHAADCDCGWGGDTGGGGSGSGGSVYRSLQVMDGFTWRFDRRPTYDSFVNPNAICPVCGASVYFYQSPFGGRVFFDELGPPWPKHPCTDNGSSAGVSRREHNFVFGLGSVRAPKTPPLHRLDVWRPLLAEELVQIGDFQRVRMPQGDRLPGKYVYVPAGWVGDAPAYWRWSPENASFIEISCIRLMDQRQVEIQTFLVPNWFWKDEDFEQWRANPSADLTPETFTAIGFALSFAWRLHESNLFVHKLPCVDFARAKSYFEQAAKCGYWVAINNLGVMYRDGLGVERDPSKAFELFSRAAQSLDPTPLRHLANCYRDGCGCERDAEYQAFLEELIAVRKEEQKSAA